MRVNTRSIALQDGSSSSTASSSPPAKTNLKHIIELTEEQEAPVADSPKEQQQSAVPTGSRLQSLRDSLACLGNLWQYVCRKPTRVELDVNDSEFASVIKEIRSQKSYYASVLPPQRGRRKVLVLDLDETLIHTSFSRPEKYDYESEVVFNGRATRIYTTKRFMLESFLFEMSRLYEIVIFTASQKLYADKVIDLIDPKRRVAHRLYRDHCIVINKTYYLKNLKILGRDLSDVLIVDDNSIAGLLHPDNFYKIDPFDGNPKDRQLCRLAAFLKHVHGQQLTPVGASRKRFEEIEIDLEEAVSGPVAEGRDVRSMSTRKKMQRHKKTNSEVEALVQRSEMTEEAEATAGQLMVKAAL